MTYADDRPNREPEGINVAVHIVSAVLLFILGAIVLILATAFFLGLLGANPEASFAAWIYDMTSWLMTPFKGIFDPIEISEGFAIRTSLLFAIVVYSALGALVRASLRRLG